MQHIAVQKLVLVLGIAAAVGAIGTAAAAAQLQSRFVDDVAPSAEPVSVGPRLDLGVEPISGGQLYVRRSNKGLCIGSDEGEVDTEGCGLGVPSQRAISFIEVEGDRSYVIGLAVQAAHTVEIRFGDGSVVRVATAAIPDEADAHGVRFFHAAPANGSVPPAEIIAYDEDGQEVGRAGHGG